MKSMHLNNHITSKQDVNKFAKELFHSIVESGHREIVMSIDDGDGDVWKYDIQVLNIVKVPQIKQIKEN